MCEDPRVIFHPSLKSYLLDRPHVKVYIRGEYFGCYHTYDSLVSDCKRFKQLFRVQHKDDMFVVFPNGTKYPLFLQCPCGKCATCRYAKSVDFANRCIMEYASTGTPPIFATITYDDNHLPADGVSREDVTDFLNRFHQTVKSLGLPRTRVVVCAEYGTNPNFTQRPHYHLLIFGLQLTKSQVKSIQTCREFTYSPFTRTSPNYVIESLLRPSWRRCKRYHAEFPDNSVAVLKYVSKYVFKQFATIGDSPTGFVPVGKHPPFISTPRVGGALGSDYFYSHVDYFAKCVLSNTQPVVRTPDGNFPINIPYIFRSKIFKSFSKVVPSPIIRKLKYVLDFSQTQGNPLSYLRESCPELSPLLDSGEYVPFGDTDMKYLLDFNDFERLVTPFQLDSHKTRFRRSIGQYVDSHGNDSFDDSLLRCYKYISDVVRFWRRKSLPPLSDILTNCMSNIPSELLFRPVTSFVNKYQKVQKSINTICYQNDLY